MRIRWMELVKRFVISYGNETRRWLHNDTMVFTETLIRDVSPWSVWCRTLIMLNLIINMQCGDDTRRLTDPYVKLIIEGWLICDWQWMSDCSNLDLITITRIPELPVVLTQLILNIIQVDHIIVYIVRYDSNVHVQFNLGTKQHNTSQLTNWSWNPGRRCFPYINAKVEYHSDTQDVKLAKFPEVLCQGNQFLLLSCH